MGTGKLTAGHGEDVSGLHTHTEKHKKGSEMPNRKIGGLEGIFQRMQRSFWTGIHGREETEWGVRELSRRKPTYVLSLLSHTQ